MHVANKRSIQSMQNHALMTQKGILTDTRSDRGAALLVAYGAAVTSTSSDSVLARALTGGLVAGFSQGSYWMAVASWKKSNKKIC